MALISDFLFLFLFDRVTISRYLTKMSEDQISINSLSCANLQ